jgi:hypothetical protein
LKVSTKYEKPATRRLTNRIPRCVEAAVPEYRNARSSGSPRNCGRGDRQSLRWLPIARINPKSAAGG